jgi:hypothetical protein
MGIPSTSKRLVGRLEKRMSHMDMKAAERQKRHGRAIYGPVWWHSRLDDATMQRRLSTPI